MFARIFARCPSRRVVVFLVEINLAWLYVVVRLFSSYRPVKGEIKMRFIQHTTWVGCIK